MTNEPPRKRVRTKTTVAGRGHNSAVEAPPSTVQVCVDLEAEKAEIVQDPVPASSGLAPTNGSLASGIVGSRGTSGSTFLRLSADSRPSVKISRLVYLDRPVTVFGRAPTCDVVLDSVTVPRMISRVHGRIAKVDHLEKGATWQLSDGGSMNGILVNDGPISTDQPTVLKTGDVITFGRKMSPPEFEFIFEAAAPESDPNAAAESAARSTFDDIFRKEMQKIEQQRKEIEVEKQELQRREGETDKKPRQSALDVSDLESELLCSVCRDWIVQASTLDCAHSFCGTCIDTWLVTQKKFECPVCRHPIKREPVPSRTLDTIVRKSVDRLPEPDQKEFAQRCKDADSAAARRKKHHDELERSVNEALAAGKDFFHINGNWSKKEKQVFQHGVKDYVGDTREVYCRLTGLTVQWIHSANEDKLNKALHNLGLVSYVGKTDEEIRQRFLMFLRYG